MNVKLFRNLALGALTGLLLTGCKNFADLPEPEVTLVSPVSAKRIGPLIYEISNLLPEGFDIYLTTREGKRLSPKPISSVDTGSVDVPSKVIVSVDQPHERYYFELSNENNKLLVSERQLPLQGSDNFRDLGGLPAADGRFVKWGMFYRADKLSELTESDLKYLNSLDLKTIIDFRSEAEISADPDVLPKGASYLNLPIYNEAEDTSDIKGRLLKGLFGVEEANNLLVEVNKLLGSSEAFRFQPFIDQVVENEGVPMVYHCTSGKDRTGFATYLILHALGVDSALIFDDYLMSNYYRFDRNRKNLRMANLGQYLKPINPEVLKPLMLVDPKYLRAAVDAINESYGSVDVFMAEQFGVTDSVRTQLRDRYLYTSPE